MKVCLIAGGTGGHIYPALALAKALKDQDSNHEVFFIGNHERMESVLIPQHGYTFEGLSTKGLQGNIFNKLYALYTLFFNRSKVKSILNKYNPDVVIGFGGYVCVPVIMEAKHLGIKTFLHEQNAIAGKANLFLANKVDAIVASYENNLKEFPKYKTRLLGNPRTYIFKQNNDEININELYQLDSNKKTVLFVMGSLGSESINLIMGSVLELLDKNNIQCIYVTGKQHYSSFIELNDETTNIKIVPYIDQISVMQHVDLMVTRGGATTAAEIMVTGCPSIIIPSPFVPNNHQYFNAKALMENNASILVEEKLLDSQKLNALIIELLEDEERLNDMRRNAIKLGHPNAANDFIDWIYEVLSNG
jgi:UDP-N-acetylglucosamine--N-acetylmuramyl-(pentapeptide) pyrophosphoryl-undecaprenol N-acetylglucosamine transferase